MTLPAAHTRTDDEIAELQAPGASRRRSLGRLLPILYPIASLVVCVIFWKLSITWFDLPTYMMPTPESVVQVLVGRFGMLMEHTWITTLETLLGFLLSVAIGVPLALMIVWSRLIEQTVYPILVISQSVPKVALAPLLLVWIGFGIETKVVVAVLIAFFPVVISTVVGLKGVPRDMIDLGRSMALGPIPMFFKIRLPQALPSVFGGLKVSITLAVVGAVVGEFVGADRGLGYLILLSSGQLQMDIMFAAIVLLVVVGVALFAMVQWAEHVMLPWHTSVRTHETET